jgi:hypothetical protein
VTKRSQCSRRLLRQTPVMSTLYLVGTVWAVPWIRAQGSWGL